LLIPVFLIVLWNCVGFWVWGGAWEAGDCESFKTPNAECFSGISTISNYLGFGFIVLAVSFYATGICLFCYLIATPFLFVRAFKRTKKIGVWDLEKIAREKRIFIRSVMGSLLSTVGVCLLFGTIWVATAIGKPEVLITIGQITENGFSELLLLLLFTLGTLLNIFVAACSIIIE